MKEGQSVRFVAGGADMVVRFDGMNGQMCKVSYDSGEPGKRIGFLAYRFQLETL